MENLCLQTRTEYDIIERQSKEFHKNQKKYDIERKLREIQNALLLVKKLREELKNLRVNKYPIESYEAWVLKVRESGIQRGYKIIENEDSLKVRED